MNRVMCALPVYSKLSDLPTSFTIDPCMASLCHIDSNVVLDPNLLHRPVPQMIITVKS